MNLSELKAGTKPLVPIELPMTSPIPGLCGCTWGVDLELRVKYIRWLYADCLVLAHRIAFGDARALAGIELEVVKEEPKKARGERGKDKNVRARKQSA